MTFFFKFYSYYKVYLGSLYLNNKQLMWAFLFIIENYKQASFVKHILCSVIYLRVSN